MESLVGVLVLVLLVGGAGLYVARSYQKMTSGGIARHFGLEPGETAAMMWVGEIDVDISTAEKVGALALGLVAGALLGGIVVHQVRAPGVTVLLTSRGRLALITEVGEGRVNRQYFGSPAEVTLVVLGRGPRKIQGRPSVLVHVAGADGVPCPLLLHESAGPALTRWLQSRP